MINLIQKIPKYWLFQALGWGLFLAVNVFFAISYRVVDQVFVIRLFVTISLGVLFTHLMRMVIKRLKLLQQHINRQLFSFLMLSVGFSLTVGLMETLFVELFDMGFKQERDFSFFQDYISNAFTWTIFLFIWNCLYFIYHFIDESTRNQLDKLKLEALVKSLELKTIKSHINPHFIFNSLNSIRALIDENPLHARQAVTALSNILRSSMVSESQETISLEKELSIVKDYLALELIRFEDRLAINYDISSEVLNFQLPPMMLQTLVENAIKHGIAKSLKSGEITIQALKTDNHVKLHVLNTGMLNVDQNHEGFGIPSTASRLKLIFGEDASFSIQQIDEFYVQATVTFPMT